MPVGFFGSNTVIAIAALIRLFFAVVAVMVTLPSFSGVTTPSADTVAMRLSDVVNFTSDSAVPSGSSV